MAAIATLPGIAPAQQGGGLGPMHGIAMHGTPALPEGFAHLPQANPDAPQGGRIVLSEIGGFDSLNPLILQGRGVAAVTPLTLETLMGRSYDEPFSLYGLLAETVETDEARSWVEFTLREEARFSDGSPVTVADVMWSFETLGTIGAPRFHAAWRKVAAMEQTGPRSVRFTFTEPDRELPLILGLRPVLSRAQFEARAFDAPSLEPLIGSGPYVVADVAPGQSIRFVRNPDWWGRGLNFYAGMHNFDEIRYDYYGDEGVAFEAFTAGLIDSWREFRAGRWETGYNIPAVASGEIRRELIPHSRPSGMTGLVFNTRRPLFADWRVREALIQLLNFEYINQTLNAGAVPRIASYFGNSALGMTAGPAEGRVAELIAPFAADLPPGALEGYALPRTDGTLRNRAGQRRALELLEEAGWAIGNDGVLRHADGTVFAFDILLEQGNAEIQSVAALFTEALRPLGITATTTVIDSAQYRARVNEYDFDMTRLALSMSLSPGTEQYLYFGAQGVTAPGTRNLAGVNDPAVEALIPLLLNARSQEELVDVAQALDRVLMAGRYVIPLWFQDRSRLAFRAHLRYPDRLPLYGDWLGFQPELWWSEE